jgi:hypothetical protein
MRSCGIEKLHRASAEQGEARIFHDLTMDRDLRSKLVAAVAVTERHHAQEISRLKAKAAGEV